VKVPEPDGGDTHPLSLGLGLGRLCGGHEAVKALRGGVRRAKEHLPAPTNAYGEGALPWGYPLGWILYPCSPFGLKSIPEGTSLAP
jgi:hypothetical protein